MVVVLGTSATCGGRVEEVMFVRSLLLFFLVEEGRLPLLPLVPLLVLLSSQ